MRTASHRLRPDPVAQQPHRPRQRTHQKLEVGGYEAEVGAQNRFELLGRTATSASRSEIVANREDEAVILDAKTGHESPSHAVQVKRYKRRDQHSTQVVGIQRQPNPHLPFARRRGYEDPEPEIVPAVACLPNQPGNFVFRVLAQCPN